jgi:hypothetical protein
MPQTRRNDKAISSGSEGCCRFVPLDKPLRKVVIRQLAEELDPWDSLDECIALKSSFRLTGFILRAARPRARRAWRGAQEWNKRREQRGRSETPRSHRWLDRRIAHRRECFASGGVTSIAALMPIPTPARARTIPCPITRRMRSRRQPSAPVLHADCDVRRRVHAGAGGVWAEVCRSTVRSHARSGRPD